MHNPCLLAPTLQVLFAMMVCNMHFMISYALILSALYVSLCSDNSVEVCTLLLFYGNDFCCQNLWLKRGSNICVHDVMKNAIASSIACLFYVICMF